MARLKKVPIIVLTEGQIWGQIDPDIKQALNAHGNTNYIVLPNSRDKFSSKDNLKDFESFAKEKAIGKFIVAGIGAQGMVDRTISGLLKEDCKVVAASDLIADHHHDVSVYPYESQYKQYYKNKNFREFKMAGVIGIVDGVSDGFTDSDPGKPDPEFIIKIDGKEVMTKSGRQK